MAEKPQDRPSDQDPPKAPSRDTPQSLREQEADEKREHEEKRDHQRTVTDPKLPPQPRPAEHDEHARPAEPRPDDPELDPRAKSERPQSGE